MKRLQSFIEYHLLILPSFPLIEKKQQKRKLRRQLDDSDDGFVIGRDNSNIEAQKRVSLTGETVATCIANLSAPTNGSKVDIQTLKR